MSKKQKTIVVTYFGDDWKKKTPITCDGTRRSFEYWHTEGLKQGVSIYRASLSWYNMKKRHFTKAWAFRDGTWKKVVGPIVPDMIYDKIGGKHDYTLHEKKLEIATHTKWFNTPYFRAHFDNKLSQYILLGEFMPTSFALHSKKELVGNIKKIKTEQVVIKPYYGSGGFNIIIDKKEKILRKKLAYPILLQEFIDGSKGIPGLKQHAVADLRVVYLNHKPAYALSRIVKGTSLFTNFHQGASAVSVPLRSIPASVRILVKGIQKKLSLFPECEYSLDFIFNKRGTPFLMEINTAPGLVLLDLIGNKQTQKRNLDAIISLVP